MRTENLVLDRPHPVGEGIQKVYRFPNGYGASVIQNSLNGRAFSYGADQDLYELGVVEFTGPGNDNWSLTYETPITDDVLGYLTEDEVDEFLSEVESLKGEKHEHRTS